MGKRSKEDYVVNRKITVGRKERGSSKSCGSLKEIWKWKREVSGKRGKKDKIFEANKKTMKVLGQRGEMEEREKERKNKKREKNIRKKKEI